jgi:hypothetical protein
VDKVEKQQRFARIRVSQFHAIGKAGFFVGDAANGVVCGKLAFGKTE